MRRGLQVRDLSRSEGATSYFAGVSFDLTTGVTALLGPNGSGKSSLMRVIAGLWPASSGTMTLDGTVLTTRRPAACRSLIGYLPQAPTWHHWMRVVDVVEMFAWFQSIPRSERAARAETVLAQVGLTAKASHRSGRLSGGEFQRLMLATAIVHAPRLLILDEPTVGLDLEQRARFRDVLRQVGDRGAMALVSTHLVDDVAAADRVLVLHEGQLGYDGTMADLMNVSAKDARHSDIERLEAGYLSLLSSERPA